MSETADDFDEELFQKVVDTLLGENAVEIAIYVLNHPGATDEDIAIALGPEIEEQEKDPEIEKIEKNTADLSVKEKIKKKREIKRRRERRRKKREKEREQEESEEDEGEEEEEEEEVLNIKIIRSILFKLNNFNLAYFRRVRNPETGYFVYHWTIDKNQLPIMVNKRRSFIKDLLQSRIDYEDTHLLYICGTPGCTPLSLDEAYEYGFVCPECREPLDEQSGSTKREFLEKVLSKL